MTKKDRAEKVNKLVEVIGDHGRGFFKCRDRYARIELDQRGRVWWTDDYTEKRIYLHYRYWGKGFSHGGTLRDLVNHLRNYVTNSTPLPPHSLGPWPDWYCEGDLWGYGDDMKRVREAAKMLELVAH